MTLLPQHKSFHQMTVTSPLPRLVLLCVLLADNCFAFPFIPSRLITRSLSVSLMQDPSVRSGEDPTSLDNNIDIMLLTETWLRPAGDEAKIADLAPPGYSVPSFPRSSGRPSVKGEGIAFVLRDSLKPVSYTHLRAHETL